MKNKFQIMTLFIIVIILLVGCRDKSKIIGEYHEFTTDDFKGMDIMPFDNMSNMKRLSQIQSQELYEYFLTIQSEESDILTEDNTPASPGESPDYSIIFHFEESDYSATVGEDYIVIALNDIYETIDEVIENTSLHLVNEEIINEFEEMINKLIEDN